MANTHQKDKFDERQENIAHTVNETSEFFEKNKKVIWGAVIAVVVIGLGIFLYHRFVYQNQVAEAMEQAYPAENLFMNGEYELALNGDGNNLGFAAIIDQYGSKASRLLCKACTDEYKRLAAQQDAAFQEFMAKKGE